MTSLRITLLQDESFLIQTARAVNTKMNLDRTVVLEELEMSALEISAEKVEPLLGEVTNGQVQRLDDLMRNEFKFPETWYKDRKTHSSAISSNLALQSAICALFYREQPPMLQFIESELKKSVNGLEAGTVVDDHVMTEFFKSACAVRARVWEFARAYYSKARERIQNKVRQKRRRYRTSARPPSPEVNVTSNRKGNASKVVEKAPEPPADLFDDDGDLSIKSSDAESQKSDEGVDERRDDQVRGIKSAGFSVSEFMSFLASLAGDEDTGKTGKLMLTFEFMKAVAASHPSGSVATGLLEVDCLTSLGVLQCVSIMCKSVDEEFEGGLEMRARVRMLKVNYAKDGFLQEYPKLPDGVGENFVTVIGQIADTSMKVARRWFPTLSASQASLSTSEKKEVASVLKKLDDIFREIDDSKIWNREEALALLWAFCKFRAFASICFATTPLSASFRRLTQYVSEISGLIL